MERYLDLGTVDTSYVLSRAEEERLNGQDAHVRREYPNTGIVRWRSYAHKKAAVELIGIYAGCTPWAEVSVPRYEHHNINEWVRREDVHVVGVAAVRRSDVYGIYVVCNDSSNAPMLRGLGVQPDGSVHAWNMIRLDAHFGVTVIFFSDIITAIVRRRREQMHAMLLATKAREDNALKRATRHTLWEPQLLRLIGQMI